ncbi:MAG: phosphatidate cytidylyltransferase [Pseudomonadota bacterium]
MSNLGQRVATAVILIPIVVGVILLLPWPWVGALFGLLVLAAAWEWTHLAGWQHRGIRAAYLVATGLLLMATTFLQSAIALIVVGSAVLWWCWALAQVIRLQRGGEYARRGTVSWALTGWILLVPSWLALVQLHQRGGGAALVLMLMVLVWSADIGAYFAGRAYGRRKLASRVSPGKSWEGVAGGTVVALMAAFGYALAFVDQALALFMVVALLTVAVSILGDLTESVFKRESDVKDSGSLLPGHGGVLDRVDSLTAAAPVFWLGTVAVGF